MGDDRNRILDLLAAGRITAEEAARLLDALDAKAGKSDDTEAAAEAAKSSWSKFFAAGIKTDDKAKRGTGGTAADNDSNTKKSGSAKFLYVKVLSTKGDNVNVKIPLGVIRAGLKLTTLIPKPAADQINKAMAEKGMTFDLNNLKPEDLQELIDALAEMEIEVDANNGDTVRVYAA